MKLEAEGKAVLVALAAYLKIDAALLESALMRATTDEKPRLEAGAEVEEGGGG